MSTCRDTCSGHRQIRRIDRFLWSGVVIVVVAIVITIIVAASPRIGITLKVMGTGPDIDVIFRWIAGSG